LFLVSTALGKNHFKA